MYVDKYILTEAISAFTGVTVKLKSDCKHLDGAIQLQIVNLPSLSLLNNKARLVEPESLLAYHMTRLGINDRWDGDTIEETPKRKTAKSSLRKQLFVISDDFFDPAYDFDFTNMSELDDDSGCMRGGEPYMRPYGWMRFALKVWDKYPDGNAWLGTGGWRNRSAPGEWPVSYHGTDLKGAEGIIQSHYKAGDRQAYGRGIYSSPDINVADGYATTKIFTSQSNGKTYKVVMQNRINPQKRKITINKKFWLVPIPKGTSAEEEREIVESTIRPYGLLLKEV